MQSCDLNPVVIEEVDMGDYKRKKVILETEPGIFMPLYVLIPGDIKEGEKRPAVIAAHGHGGGGKLATACIRDNPVIQEAIEKYNYSYGVDFVRKGLIVFCPDARGFGERREKTSQGNSGEEPLYSSCTVLNNMALPLGMTVTGMWVWDLMRLIDYIYRRDDCLNNRIGCVGLSGGGLQTLWLAALDDRISCAVISGYFYGYRQALLEMPNGCSCNYIPHLWEKADMGDIGALIAPRPLLIETGDEDELNGEGGLSNVYPQVEIARQAYELFGKENELHHHVFHSGHRWNGEKGVGFLCKSLTIY
jgi:dienelactone hydrolase